MNYVDISTNRSKHNLKAHIILVCKYRKKLLKGDLNNFIKAKVDEISESGEFIILAMESDIDHIHLMIQYLPRVSKLHYPKDKTNNYFLYLERQEI
ncbi:Transposase and inactivated derivatives [Campylobacter jejuni subsp. doylei]|nr:Transposase and inactivated derivatives [Campylobacter jejuni subsp. doylei]